MSEHKKSVKEKLIEETKAYLLVALYLMIFLAAFTNYRRLIMKEVNVGYFEYGYAVIEAMILGKLVIIGKALGVGNRFKNSPLIVPTLYKTFCFSILVIIFSLIEHLIGGLWHHENLQQIGEKIASQGIWEILARMLMLATAFVPLFATWEIGAVVGEGRLLKLFFKKKEKMSPGENSETFDKH